MGLFDFLGKKNNSIEEIKRISNKIETYITRLEKAEDAFKKDQEELSKPLPNHILAIVERKLEFDTQVSKKLREIETLKSIDSSDPDFQFQLECAIKNFGALNAVAEMELKNANDTMKASNEFESSYLSSSDMTDVHKEISSLRKENLILQETIKELMKAIDLDTIQ
ncbi:hypothetical protein [Flammeovirga sp. SJP92]|uniref:hypothetical protein n=1 Tax=Flammeovirga sp. SJP92 TaxID=1775430 RepID=UPI000786E1F5|nr:hypothetical protein [Flammeovirga sp. SJP92]KXX67963.1 hypothetical protein AVL50_24200 [Flammeovirga sp. SJP92]